MSAKHAELVAHYVDLMSDVAPVRSRAMFGGHGLYADDVMFALVDAEGDLYFKADAEIEAEFVAAGCAPFVFTSKSGRSSTMSYRRAPAATLDDRDAMAHWTRLAMDASQRAAHEKKSRR